MKLVAERPEELKALLASISYLESEAKKAGFQELSAMLGTLILEVKDWVEHGASQKQNQVETIKKSELYKTILLIDKIAHLNTINVDAISEAIEVYSKKSRTTH